MTAYKYPPRASVHVTETGEVAFLEGSDGADQLILGRNKFLISDSDEAVVLSTAGSWTVSVDGTIRSDKDHAIGLFTADAARSSITILSHGVVTGDRAAILANTPVTIKNAGHIISDTTHTGDTGSAITIVNTAGNKIINTGVISSETIAIQGDAGTETLINAGKIVGNVDLAAGDDSFTNYQLVQGKMHSGQLPGFISLGAGDDHFFGGNAGEIVLDGDGADTIKFGGGNDSYTAVGNKTAGNDGHDTIDGGKGTDTYAAGSSGGPLSINLDKVAHDGSPFENVSIDAQTATGADVSQNSVDTIKNFEDVLGGFAGDTVYGSASANSIAGQQGSDYLAGYGGNDKLNGGDDQDFLYGGAGKDTLIGGGSGDWFEFASIKDSGIAKATRDVIMDLDSDDRIDLSRIDANVKTNDSHEQFQFIGTDVAFSGHGKHGTPGEVRAATVSTGYIVYGDVNGDRKADFSIEIRDPHHSLAFASDGSNFFFGF